MVLVGPGLEVGVVGVGQELEAEEVFEYQDDLVETALVCLEN